MAEAQTAPSPVSERDLAASRLFGSVPRGVLSAIVAEVNDEYVAEGRYPEDADDEDEREFWSEVERRVREHVPDG